MKEFFSIYSQFKPLYVNPSISVRVLHVTFNVYYQLVILNRCPINNLATLIEFPQIEVFE